MEYNNIGDWIPLLYNNTVDLRGLRNSLEILYQINVQDDDHSKFSLK